MRNGKERKKKRRRPGKKSLRLPIPETPIEAFTTPAIGRLGIDDDDVPCVKQVSLFGADTNLAIHSKCMHAFT